MPPDTPALPDHADAPAGRALRDPRPRGGNRGKPKPKSPPTLERVLSGKEIVVTCGPGGVGKTTTSAAIAAMSAYSQGGRVLVLTIDPARRLADALGLGASQKTPNTPEPVTVSNSPVRVPPEAFADAGVKLRGELWVAMLDAGASWDDLIRRHAPDDATRDEILANPLYRSIASRFVQSHDYIAMERLYDLHTAGTWDLIVIDTPPTRHALDFLDAPDRMADFFSSRLLRWLIVPYRSRLVNLASKPFYQVADRILGTQFLEDISRFFILFQTMYDGFVERSRAVTRLLSDERTTFLVVTTLEAAPVREAHLFSDELNRRGLHLGAVVANRVLPPSFCDPDALGAAQAMEDSASELAAGLAPTLGIDPAPTERVLGEIAESFRHFSIVAVRESELLARLGAPMDALITVPFFETDIADVEDLLALGEHLWA